MVNRIKTIYSHRLNKGFGSKFYEDSQIQQKTFEEDCRAHWLKYAYNSKDEGNSLNTLNNINF